MRNDADLLREHAEQKARQAVRLAAAQRRDADDPRHAIIRDAMGGISGVRTTVTLLVLSVVINALFVAVGMGALGGLRRALIGGIFWIPLIIAPLAIVLIDRRSMAGWKVHALLGLIATGMLIGVPIIISLLMSLLVPARIFDYDAVTGATLYLEYLLGFLPLYALGLVILAVITGAILAFWDRRVSN